MSPQSLLRAFGRVARANDGRMAIVGVIAVVLLVLQSGVGQFVLRVAGVSHKSPSFVELYFPDARSLPTSLPKTDRLDVRFAVGNISSVTRTITWHLTETKGNSHLPLGQGRSVVGPGRTNLVSRTVFVSSARLDAHNWQSRSKVRRRGSPCG